MVPKIALLVVISAFLTLCQTANIPRNYSHFTYAYTLRATNNIQLQPRALTEDKQATINTATTTSRPIVQTTVESSSSAPSTTTPINDVDYWSNDDFQPFKVDSRDAFDWRLLQEIFTKVRKNVVISPFSVKFVMAILSEAADAESVTKKELASIFNRETSPQLMRENYRDLLLSLKEKSPKYTLNFATNMYVRSYIQPRPQYKRVLNEVYDTDIQGLDFSQAESAANSINDWCKNVTEGHLTNLVNSDNIQNSVLLLINAIYFDGKWRTPFLESYESVFFRQPSEQIRAEYMTVKDKFYYFHSTMWNAKVLRLPYQGKKFSMTIILPGARGGIEELSREIEGDGLRRIQWLMTEQTVKVTLPKFKFDSTSHLKETLMALGINEIFNDGAALSGIAQGSSLYKQMKVSDFIQKAGIEVHESGTTAFAATDVEIVNKFGGDDSEEFNANRPFIFIIVDEATTNIIFAGKVLDPTA